MRQRSSVSSVVSFYCDFRLLTGDGQLAWVTAPVVKFEDDGQAMQLVGAGKGTGRYTAGTRFAHDDLYPSTRVFRTGRSVRIGREDFEAASGPVADALRHERLAGFASPIIVDGHLWGTMLAPAEKKPMIEYMKTL